MGRPVGSKNKRTRYREAREAMEKHAALLDKAVTNEMTSFDYIGESLVCMGEALKEFVEYARSLDRNKQRALRLEAYKQVVDAAAILAPYRYPKYATTKIKNDRGTVLVDDSVTYDDVLNDLAEHMAKTGTSPRKMTGAVSAAKAKPKPPPPRPPRPPPPPPPPG